MISSSFAVDHSGQDAMNGISYQDYKDFPDNWKLVTIRFRKDTGEMRLTYANDLAMKTLLANSINYPDGAVFAKTGIHTGLDPQFVSSVIPKGIRRYQLMVRDRKKYAQTGGWGYALFDPQGKTFPEDPKVTQDACYACHTMVENRGDVFSEPFSFNKSGKLPSFATKEIHSKISYAWISVKKLPSSVAKFVPKTLAKVRMITNDILRKKVFQGTLDELKPVLEHEARQSKGPALFLSHDEKRFVLLVPTKSQECMDLGAFEVTSTDISLKPLTERYCTHD